jgi:hypothetical protein
MMSRTRRPVRRVHFHSILRHETAAGPPVPIDPRRPESHITKQSKTRILLSEIRPT